MMVDGHGRKLEVILIDRGRGPKAWIGVSWSGILLGPGCPPLGPGYYRSHHEALEWVDESSLVEVINLRPSS